MGLFLVKLLFITTGLFWGVISCVEDKVTWSIFSLILVLLGINAGNLI